MISFCFGRIRQIWLYNLIPQGLEIVFRVGLALLQMNQAELMQLDMEGMLQVSQAMISWMSLDFTIN